MLQFYPIIDAAHQMDFERVKQLCAALSNRDMLHAILYVEKAYLQHGDPNQLEALQILAHEEVRRSGRWRLPVPCWSDQPPGKAVGRELLLLRMLLQTEGANPEVDETSRQRMGFPESGPVTIELLDAALAQLGEDRHCETIIEPQQQLGRVSSGEPQR